MREALELRREVLSLINTAKADKQLTQRAICRMAQVAPGETVYRVFHKPDLVSVGIMLKVFRVLDIEFIVNNRPIETFMGQANLGDVMGNLQSWGFKAEVIYGS